LQQEKKVSRLRRPFVIGGAAIGAVLCGWYLYNNFGRVTPVPDPIWTRFVNLAVIMFLCIYLANLLRVAVDFFLRRR
jgi:hypothetical protein